MDHPNTLLSAPIGKTYSVFSAPNSQRSSPFKQIHLICNPYSGGKRSLTLLAHVIPQLQKAGIESIVVMTQYAGHAKDLANTLDLKDAVCAIGGDGTMHEIVNGMMSRQDGRRVPIGMIPGGQ
jgi:diacylglycerol kinase family enzyme